MPSPSFTFAHLSTLRDADLNIRRLGPRAFLFAGFGLSSCIYFILHIDYAGLLSVGAFCSGELGFKYRAASWLHYELGYQGFSIPFC